MIATGGTVSYIDPGTRTGVTMLAALLSKPFTPVTCVVTFDREASAAVKTRVVTHITNPRRVRIQIGPDLVIRLS